MEKIELFDSLGMSAFFDGGSFEYNIKDLVINNENEIHKILDEICLLENLTPLKGGWNKLSFLECRNLLLNAFRYDLAYTSFERMPEITSQHFQGQILDRIDKDKCICYTNWFNDPWSNNTRTSWNSITEHTFDMAIAIVDNNKVVFAYFIGED